MNTTCKIEVIGNKVHYRLTAKTLDDIECRIDGLLRRYHPMGYGTVFSEPAQNADGLWVSQGTRSQSCD
jgi:hypothetical protein